jgi:hypothetical protein
MLDHVPAHHNLKVLLQITAAGRVVAKRKQRDERLWSLLAAFDTSAGADNGWLPILVADHTTGHLRFLGKDQGDDRRLPGTIEVGSASGLNPSTYDEWVDYLEHMIPWLVRQILMPGTRLLERGISPH